MKLYEKLNDGSIQLREMQINPDKEKDYKIKIIKDIPIGKRIFNASCTDKEKELTPNKTSYYHNLNFSDSGIFGGHYYHRIEFFEDMEIDNQIKALIALKEYYSGVRKKYEIAKIIGNDSKFPLNPQYILLGSKDYDNQGKMNNNIVIPKILMELQKFEDGNLEYANSEIVKLFDISDPLDNSIIPKKMFNNWLNLMEKGQPINLENPGFGISKENFKNLLHLGFNTDLYEKVKQTKKILKLKKDL